MVEIWRANVFITFPAALSKLSQHKNYSPFFKYFTNTYTAKSNIFLCSLNDLVQVLKKEKIYESHY